MLQKITQVRVYSDDDYLILSQRKNATRFINNYFGKPCVTFDFKINNKESIEFLPTKDDLHNYSKKYVSFVHDEIQKFILNSSNKTIYFVIKNPIKRAISGIVEDVFKQIRVDASNRNLFFMHFKNSDFLSNDLDKFRLLLLDDKITPITISNYSTEENLKFLYIIFENYLLKFINECDIFTEHNTPYLFLFYTLMIKTNQKYKIIDLSDDSTLVKTIFENKKVSKNSNFLLNNLIYRILDSNREIDIKFHNLMFFEQNIYDIIKDYK